MAGFSEDIQAVYALADLGTSLPRLIEAILEVLKRHPEELKEITASYGIYAVDTGFAQAFALAGGKLSLLAPGDAAEVTISGTAENLLLIFQRKLTPVKALLLGKVKIKGNRGVLIKLAAFL